jgi:hypothetical protein
VGVMAFECMFGRVLLFMIILNVSIEALCW